MSRILSLRKTRGREKARGAGQFGVADADTQELDVKRTRRGMYSSPGPQPGTTWKKFMHQYNEKRRTPSPSSQFQTTSTEAMDTDEAQRVTAKVVKTLMEKQEGEKQDNPPTTMDEEEETVATMGEIEQTMEEKKKEKEMEEFLASTKQPLDDSKISFKPLSQGEETRAEMTEENLEDTVVFSESEKRPQLVEEDFEQTSKMAIKETEKLNEKKVIPKMTYVSSDGTGDPKPKEGPSGVDPYEEIEGAPHHYYYVPIKGNPPVSHFKPIREELTPRGDSMGVVIEIPQWEEQYGTKTYGVDRRYGIIYAVKDGEWGRFVKACNCFPQKELEESKDRPMAGLKSPQEVQTPKSQDEVPLAESTRKKNKFSRVTIKDLGASHSDLNTVGFSESSTDISTSSDDTAKIQQEIEETEKANKALEEERLKIERERIEMVKEQH